MSLLEESARPAMAIMARSCRSHARAVSKRPDNSAEEGTAMLETRWGKAVVIAVLTIIWGAATRGSIAQQPAGDVAELKAEIEALKGMLPSQSHSMVDVEFQYANLWFAGKNQNWPLATFYLNETRSHLNWTVRLRPVRKLSNGGDLDLRPILKGIEDGGLASIKAALDKHDEAAFETAYKGMLGQCIACHEAAEKPFLRPDVPKAPPSPLIDMRPHN
jgi:cytochrome c553